MSLIRFRATGGSGVRSEPTIRFQLFYHCPRYLNERHLHNVMHST